MIVDKIICNANTQIIIKENSEPVGAIQTVESSDKENILNAHRVVFNMLKISNQNVKNISFDIVIKRGKQEDNLGPFRINNHSKIFVASDYIILSTAQLEIH